MPHRCRAENLCHSLRNGIGAMWLASADGVCEKMEEDIEFMESNLHVMKGDATVPEDKVTLVVPILGLYAELVARDLAEIDPKRNGERKRKKMADIVAQCSDVELSASGSSNAERSINYSSPHAVLNIINRVGKAEIFPEKLVFDDGKTRELFGPLVGMMEKLLREDEGVRQQLVERATLRNKNMGHIAKSAAKAWKERSSIERSKAKCLTVVEVESAPRPVSRPSGSIVNANQPDP